MTTIDDLKKFDRGWVVGLAAMLCVLGGATSASAQGTTAQFDLNQFRPSELTTDGFAVSTADAQGHKRFGFQIYMDYADDELVFEGAAGSSQAGNQLRVVSRDLTGHFTWSLGLWDHLVIFMDLPFSFIVDDRLSTDEVDFLNSIGEGGLVPRGSGLGDVYLGARGNLFGTREDVFQIALQATLTANTASAADQQENYLGEGRIKPYIGGWFEALLTFNAGDHVRIPINVGYKTAFSQDVTRVLRLGNQFTWGAGVQALALQDQLMFTVESFGRTAAQSSTGIGGREETPVEVLAGVKYLPKIGFAVGLAGSAGVTPGYGAPDWRLIGMIGYTMPEKKAAVSVDTDGDGISDDLDQCPTEAEDLDGFQDEDGCPDFDNDGDGILDVDDGCPMDPEDIDGFEDQDGCPDFDNDGDGILDVDDMCPDEPGPADNNGCPEADRDGDGVPDRIDNCPDEPGTVENQGCQNAQLVVIGDGKLEILEKVYFRTGSAKLQPRSFALLDNVAAVINAHPEYPIIRVEGHSDSTGALKFNMRLSQKRAETVVRYLVGRGKVSRDRLIAEGFGPTRPIVPDAKTREELAQNRRVEFHIAQTGPEGADDQSGER
ncbi:MAG: OmpA family protein [Polyangiales bacterium]